MSADFERIMRYKKEAARKERRNYYWLAAALLLVFILAFLRDSKDDGDQKQSVNRRTPTTVTESKRPEPHSYNCIDQDTWGAFTEEDLDRIIEYSVNDEEDLLAKMIVSQRVIKIRKGTRIILSDVGLLSSVVRIPNNETRIWVLTEHLGGC